MEESGVARAWSQWTEPHESVVGVAACRRARLAASLNLVMAFLAAFFVGFLEVPDWLAHGRVALSSASLGMFGTAAAFALARSRRPAWGVTLGLATSWLIIWDGVVGGGHASPDVVYFTLVPVLFGGLLLGLMGAAALACANMLVIAVVPAVLPLFGRSAEASDFLLPFLFMLTATPIVLVGTGFMQRALAEAEGANRRLREAEAFRLRLLNTVAHDLASPLTPIALQLHMLKGRDAVGPQVAIMARNVAVLGRLVDDVKDLARLESGELALRPAETDVAGLVRDVVEGFAAKADADGIRLSVDAPPHVFLMIDAVRITQVITNLVTNALKFTPSGGSVVLTMTVAQGEVRLAVCDSGRGLAEAEIRRLFQPFSQVHAPSEARERGSGLGLFITKGIVAAHDGHVWVESAGHGHGSTFVFALPLLSETKAAATSTGAREAPRGLPGDEARATGP